MPAVTPVTFPVLLTVAAAPVAGLQLPPLVASVNAVADPAQTFMVPVIPAGKGLTVTVAVRLHPVAAV